MDGRSGTRWQWLGGLVAAVVAAALVTAAIGALGSAAPAQSLAALYVLAILPVAFRWGLVPALVCALTSNAAFNYFYVEPTHSFSINHTEDAVIVSVTAATAVVVSLLASRVRQQAREGQALAREQAALRRVATLVARAAPPEEVFASVADEVGALLAVDFTVLSRYDADGSATIVAAWRSPGGTMPELGTRVPPGERSLHSLVFEGERSARNDDYAAPNGVGLNMARESGVQSAVAAPIHVADRLWGAILVAYTRDERLPGNTEARLTAFAELVSTAIANAVARADLVASRQRIVATADATRRAIERDLHDGTQQRLVSVAVQVRGIQTAIPPETPGLADRLDDVVADLTSVVDELRETARGIHPSILVEGGLGPALRALARRSAVPVHIDDVAANERFPDQTEVAAYYVVAEALTNAAKHAHASEVDVSAAAQDGVLVIRVGDDGRGGATLGAGSGLVGLQDRVEAVGGVFRLHSPPGGGTIIEVTLPVGPSSAEFTWPL